MMGVLNEGIAGNRILSEVVGPSALARFDRDVLAQNGVTHVILLEGINDLGLGGNGALPTVAEIIAGHRQIVERAHSHGLKVIAGTFLPFEGTNLGAIAPGYYSVEKDMRRQAINDFIRNGRAYDGLYLLKGGGKQVWKLFPRIKREWRKPQGVILGKRCGVTQSLGPTARLRSLMVKAEARALQEQGINKEVA
jgi:lysophospholipase L1-like esterase